MKIEYYNFIEAFWAKKNVHVPLHVKDLHAQGDAICRPPQKQGEEHLLV
jgi:hypothetical protein